MESLLVHHDAAQVEVFCYSDVAMEDEVTARLDPMAFTIETMAKRLKKVGDLFAPALHGAQRLPTFAKP